MFSQRDYDEDFLNEVVTNLKGWERRWVISTICRTQTVSEQFMEKWSEDLDWNGISTKQNISENFMKKFPEKINWTIIKSRNISIPNDLIKYTLMTNS